MERNNELKRPGGPEESVTQGAPIGWERGERVAKLYVVQNVQS